MTSIHPAVQCLYEVHPYRTGRRHTAARAGEIVTSRGTVRTPVFMPVATRGPSGPPGRDVDELAFDIILPRIPTTSTCARALRCSARRGLHAFMRHHRPILTDSGGFQVFSLSDFCRVSEDGVEFRSTHDGSLHFFTPEKVLEIQEVIGSDIMMVLDQCTDYPIDAKRSREAMERTLLWAARSRLAGASAWSRGPGRSSASSRERVRRPAEGVHRAPRGALLPLGYAVGGLSVGEPKELYRDMTAPSTLPPSPTGPALLMAETAEHCRARTARTCSTP